jgi:hypothetical protein
MTALLNVVLGMLLVYLIFAIVVSRLQEWVAQRLCERGKHLREGIYRLIGDEDVAARLLRHSLISGLYKNPSARASPPSYIEPESFGLALASIILRRGNSQQPLTYLNLRTAIERFSAQRSPVAEALLPIMDRANGDLPAALKGIEDWFSAGMDRVSGWYKTKSRKMLFRIGLVLAILFNIDSIAIFQALNHSPAQAARLAQVAEEVNKAGNIDSVDIMKEAQGLPIGYRCMGAATALAANNTPDKSLWTGCRAELEETWSNTTPSQWFMKLLGWILTAFAGSLGASYWFAAISKVIDIRSSGPRPAEAKVASKPTV